MKITSVRQIKSSTPKFTESNNYKAKGLSTSNISVENHNLPPSYNFLLKTNPSFGQGLPCFPFNHETMGFIIPNKALRKIKPHIKEMISPVTIPSFDNTELNGWFINPRENKEVFLFLNGTNSNRTWQEEVIKFFHKNGYGALIPDYRGFAENAGEATEKTLYQDAEASLKYLNDKGYKDKDIILWGYSMGGAVARKIAPQNNFKFAVIDSSITNEYSIKDYFFEVGLADKSKIPQSTFDNFVRQKQSNEPIPFDTVKEIKKVDYPILFLHSRADKIVPSRMTESQFDYANNINSKMVISGGEDPHFYRNWTFDYILDFDKSIK